MGIGARLRAVRMDRGYSQQRIADVIGCGQSNVHHIESGKQAPTVFQLRRLAALYNCLMEELVEGDLPLGRTLTEVTEPGSLPPIRILQAAEPPSTEPPRPHPRTRHHTREITRKEIEAALNRRDALEAAETMRRLGVELTPEQHALIAEKTTAA